MPDPELLQAIHREIAGAPFAGEGLQKAHRPPAAARRVHQPQTGAAADARARAARPTPTVRRGARRLHDGRITTDTRDELWATDPSEAWTGQDGRCAVFAVVDRCTGEAWVDAAPRMDRWAAADLLREAILDRFGSVRPGRLSA